MSPGRNDWLSALLLGRDDDARRSSIVAEHILWLRYRAQVDTTPMHVLKIGYVCHGWMLAVHERPLLTEAVEAWTYGPVIPSIYHQYKSYGAQSIVETGVDHSDEFEQNEAELVGLIEETYSSPWKKSVR